MNKEYLGDGLYAEWDGWNIILSAPRENGDHWVGLEPTVFDALIRYKERVYKEAERIYKEKNNEPTP